MRIRTTIFGAGTMIVALLLAAREGHEAVVDALMAHGASDTACARLTMAARRGAEALSLRDPGFGG